TKKDLDGEGFGATDGRNGVALGVANERGDEAVVTPGDESVQPLRVGGEVKPPKLLRRVEPTYPEAARRSRGEGRVVLEIVIGADGKVAQARVVRSIPGLDEAALAAVKQWVYAPTVNAGVRVPLVMTVTVDFRRPAPETPSKPEPPASRPTGPGSAFLLE